MLCSTCENMLILCKEIERIKHIFLQQSPEYTESRCNAFVCDVTKEEDIPIPESSLDVIVLIFIFSAICPEK